MFCSKCGNQLPEDAKFCDACGAPVDIKEDVAQTAVEPAPESEDVEPEQPKGRKVTDNIVLGTDGKYHWYYEFKLMKNPTILKLLLKIFFWIDFGIWAMLVVVDLLGGRMDWKNFVNISKTFLLMYVIFVVLVCISYFIYALIQGFKYCVMFEMDDKGVTHTQMPKQFKKAQAIGFLTMLMGAAAGKPGVVGTGMLAASKSSMSSSWSNVKSVEIIRKRNVIKVNERLNRNQVYAEDVDFQFVADYIKAHVTKKCKISE